MYEHIYQAKLAKTVIDSICHNKDDIDNLERLEDLSFNISGMLNNSIRIVNWLNISEICHERVIALKNNQVTFNIELLNKYKEQLKTYLDINIETEDYNQSASSKREIINKFIDFKHLTIIKSVKVSPDKRLTLFTVDDKKFVLDETDYLVDYNDASDIMKTFGANAVHWLKPKKEFINNDYNHISINDICYGLANLN